MLRSPAPPPHVVSCFWFQVLLSFCPPALHTHTSHTGSHVPDAAPGGSPCSVSPASAFSFLPPRFWPRLPEPLSTLTVFHLLLFTSCLLLGAFKKKIDYFLEQFSVHSKVEREVQRLWHRPPAPHTHCLPRDQRARRGFVTVDEPTWTGHHHPKSTVPRVHCWGCAFCGSERMYNGHGPPAPYHTPQWFRAPAGPLCSPWSSPSQTPGNH